MDETEQISPLIVKRRGRLRKQVDSDEDDVGKFGGPYNAGSPKSSKPGPSFEAASASPEAAAVHTQQTYSNDQQEALGDPAVRTPPPPRRLRLKVKDREGSPVASAHNSPRKGSPLVTPKTEQKHARGVARSRSSSVGTPPSDSSDADEMSDGASDSSSNACSFSSEDSDVHGSILSPLRGKTGCRSWRRLGSLGAGTEAEFQKALDWCFNRIVSERQAIATTASAEQRQYEIALWDDELTRGGTRHFIDAFFCDPTRALSAHLLPATTPEEKAVVFLDYPNELYKTEFLHLRVVEPRTRRVVLANLLKCAADQQSACREFDEWMQKNKRFFITQEEKLNKIFHLRVAEPRGLRKLQHLLLRAEQCGLVERSKSMGYRRSHPSKEFGKLGKSRNAVLPEGGCVGIEGPLGSQTLFIADDSQYSQDGFSGDDSQTRTWNESSTKGWAALKRSGASRSALSHTGLNASLQPQTLRARAKEEQKRRQEHRDAEKKQARRAALRQRWVDIQRLARSTHNGPRFHHPNREEHAKALRFTTRGFSFSRFEVVYIRPPQELDDRHREALDAYLYQLPRMHKLLAEPHKLVLASKYGLVSVTERNDLTSPPILERNVDPWQQAGAAAHWDELRGVFGYAPWDVLCAGGSFIPASLAQRLREKAKTQAALATTVSTRKKQQQTQRTTSSSRKTPNNDIKPDVATPKHTAKKTAATDQNGGTQGKHDDGAVLADVRTPSRTPTRQQSKDSIATFKRTPMSTSRLRRNVPTPPAQAERSTSSTEPSKAPAVDTLKKSENGNEGETEVQSPPAVKTPLRVQVSSAVLQQDVTEADTERESGFSIDLEGKDISPDEKAQGSVGVVNMANAPSPQTVRVDGIKLPQSTEVEGQHKLDTTRSPAKAAAGGGKQKPQTGSNFSTNVPRQMKLTDLLQFTLNKVKGKVAIALNAEALRSADADDDKSDDDFTVQKRNLKRRLIDDDTLIGESPRQQQEEFTASDVTVGASSVRPPDKATDSVGPNSEKDSGGKTLTADNTSTPAPEPIDEEEARRQEKRRQKKLWRKERSETLKKQQRLERKRQMQEILRQMMEYEAEENDEELRDDAEYAAALEELKHRLAREDDDENDDLEDSDNDFLESLIAKPEDADEDERNEDRAAMNMKLQKDLGDREEEVYERLIGRYQRNGKEGGIELTEQEILELELEERRRNEAKRRKLLGDGALADIDIDDWLSDSEESEADSCSGKEDNTKEAEEKIVRWSTIALDGAEGNTAPVASSAATTPADLAAKCQENATRRQKIQKLFAVRKKDARNSDGRGPLCEPASKTDRTRQPMGDVREDRMSQKVQSRNDSDSEDEIESLYKTASKVHTKGVRRLQKGNNFRTFSCIRFNPGHQPDLELSNSSSRAVPPVFTGFHSGVTHKKKAKTPGQPSEVQAPRNPSEQSPRTRTPLCLIFRLLLLVRLRRRTCSREMPCGTCFPQALDSLVYSTDSSTLLNKNGNFLQGFSGRSRCALWHGNV